MARLKAAMAYPLFIDGRNIHDPEQLRRVGFEYYGVGRGQSPEAGNGRVTRPTQVKATV